MQLQLILSENALKNIWFYKIHVWSYKSRRDT